MADRQTDPKNLQGEALRQWYLRTSDEIAQARDAQFKQQYRNFFGPAGTASTGDVASQSATSAPTSQARHDQQFVSPLDLAHDALEDFQKGPKIARPTTLESFIPVVGPAWEAAADLQDGNYDGAAFNAAIAVADVLPVGAVVKGAKAATKGAGVVTKFSKTATATVGRMRRAGMVAKGEEVHHSIPLNGLSRNVESVLNNPALLKVLPVETHRRIHSAWNGLPRFNALERVWYGTTDWQKTVPVAIASNVADAVENMTRPFSSQPQSKKAQR